jgi:hypothetical protein
MRCYDDGGATLERYTAVFSSKRINGVHSGKKVSFLALPDECQEAFIEKYNAFWNIYKKDYDEHLFNVLDDFVTNEIIPKDPILKRFRPQFDNVLKSLKHE